MKKYKLREDLTIVEQTYRGEQTFIVKAHVEHKYFGFSLVEVIVMQQFDGEHTCAEVAEGLLEQGLEFSESVVESFARKLDSMALLEKSVAERSVLLMERVRAQRNKRIKAQKYQGTFLRMRWSVGDPNEFFNAWTPRLGFFFSRPFIIISIALFIAYFGIVISRHEVFLAALSAMYHPSSWSLGFFATFWLTGLTVIAIHEFGHGFTCKYFGGEVHEMGAMLIYLQPAFYCNVNDAWTFPELKARLWVTAAGSWIQMVVAGIAAIVWWAAVPDTLISTVALIAVLIGGAMTLLANANPLIPLDGYYALSDYLGVPNLRKRAIDYVKYLIKRYVLFRKVTEIPVTARERKIFLIYGSLAFVYSTSLLLLLLTRFVGWVAATLGALGLIVLAVMAWNRLKNTLRAWGRGMMRSMRENKGAWRVIFRPRYLGIAAVIVAVGVLVPVTIHVGGPFAAVRPVYVVMTAPDAGIVTRVYVNEGSVVAAGAPIVTIRDVASDRGKIALVRQVDSLGALSSRARAAGREENAQHYAAQQAEAAAALAGMREQSARLELRAPVAGVVISRRVEEMTGRHVARGDTVVKLIGLGDTLELRVTLEGAGATQVRPGQPVAVIAQSDLGAPLRETVATVAESGRTFAVGTAPPRTTLEARIRVPASAAWRSGVTGQASISVRQTSLFGAIWWNLRKRLRSDVLM